jgi:thiamine biosynthesis lipoprotein
MIDMTEHVRASLNGWVREVHAEEVWGTVVTFDVRDEVLDEGAAEAIAEASAWLHQVDAWFSTYRLDTPITALRNGLATIDQMPSVVRDVLARCAMVRDLTGGVFDPWSVHGGVDPSGFVKGWAADVAADMIVDRGYPNVAVNAAGDVTLRGFQSPDQPWVVGIRHPVDPMAVVRTVEALDCAVATSGEYERGKHILDPVTGTTNVKLTSATVVGPDGGVADALATALVIQGADGVQWFNDLPDWSGYLITDDIAQFFGPAFDALEGLPTLEGSK